MYYKVEFGLVAYIYIINKETFWEYMLKIVLHTKVWTLTASLK